MALPTSVVDGATATINGIVYTYNSTKAAWYKQSTASTNVPVTISGTLSVSGNANVGNLGSPTVVNGNSNITVTANSAISIATNAAVRMTVDATGNVGIGTASPASDAIVKFLNISDATSAGVVLTGPRKYSIYSSSSSTLVFRDDTGTATRMVLDSSGNLGIANSSPAHTLSVTGTVNVSGNANVGNLGTAAVVATANITSTGTSIGLGITAPTLNGTGTFMHIHNTSTNAAMLHFTNNTTGSLAANGFIVGRWTDADGFNYVYTYENTGIRFGTNSTIRLQLEANGQATMSGNIIPGANVTYNLGSTTARWSTVYTGDLELSNGIGDYTIVEGEDDLFLYNNRSGKTYRFMLQEVDPTIVPPKKGT